jgi:hypothetical protein
MGHVIPPVLEADYRNGWDGAVPSEISIIHGASSLPGTEKQKNVQISCDKLSRSVKDWHTLSAKNKRLFTKPCWESLVKRRSPRNFMDLVLKGLGLTDKEMEKEKL